MTQQSTHIATVKTTYTRAAFLLWALLSLSIFCFSNALHASSIKDLKSQQISEILFNIHAYYVDDLSLQKTPHYTYSNQQVEVLLEQLDPYSKYLNENDLNALFNNTNGQYTGVGIEVKNIDEHITIVDVVKNSPAKDVGILAGDIIVSVNNKSTQAQSLEHVAALIKDPSFNTVAISISRKGYQQPLNFAVKRSEINLESATSELLESGAGYLAIHNFSNHTLHEVALHVAALKNDYRTPLKGLVIDLRDNPGGTLQSAVAVSDLFLQSGTIVTTKGRYYDANQAYYAKRGDILKGAPIIVLINENSASAAEILAAALKDNKRATVVGNQSYGKGSVQSLIPLGDGNTALKLTTAKYFTPSGASIEGVGITPDVAIAQATLSQSNKAVIIKNKQNKNTPQLKSEILGDLQLVKAKQLLSMQ
ncbi:carboxyl-terminal processing protease [Pseudoalteromonas espejiana DSM 9414]|uniref:Peptidase S41 n=1 Tax=Pseudoalteromonas espejiana TaxID=28107 RepID=A0A510Y1G0_9GAMM|nr:S41 family peptidase [Pseudoalteromonas espejiana]ASM51247.1 carboxyl-terminal processing protease [Pseudoalteromonas espejiana DSM 9414]GEK57033.1 peptidase S41 [Pseudoalteromonas espejiana]